MPEVMSEKDLKVETGPLSSSEMIMSYNQNPSLRGFAKWLVNTRDSEGAVDPGLFRPMLGADGRTYVQLMNYRGHKNALWDVTNEGFSAIMPRDAWLLYDTAIRRVARDRLEFVADLEGAGLTFSANLFGRTQLGYRTASDAGEANIGMDPMQRGKSDRPVLDAEFMPLPLIWCDFWFSSRDIAVSHSGDFPVDTVTAEMAARRVAEKVEDLHLGNLATYVFGGSSLYGVRNWTYRQTKVLTHPATPGWTPNTLIVEILEMRDQARGQKHYGPWGLYFSPGWSLYLDQDYSEVKGDDTLRTRIMKIALGEKKNIAFIRTLDRLADWQAVMIEMTSETIRTVKGMPMQTFQWQLDPWSQNFRVMTMQLPQFHKDYADNQGVLHATATPP